LADAVAGAEAVLENLPQCTYDSLEEWQASHRISRFDPDTIKWLKDGFLRLPMEIERHETEKEATQAENQGMVQQGRTRH
jgi:hypothetical protein